MKSSAHSSSKGECVDVLIFAGGVGRRMGSGPRPKQFLELSDRPIIDYTISKFATRKDVDRIVVVCLEDWIGYLSDYLSSRNYPVPIDIVPGGSTGADSIYNGLSFLYGLRGNAESIVLIHDGVRPLIDDDSISRCIESVRERGCTATVAPAIETIVVGDGGHVDRIFNRSKCFLARAPQGFILDDVFTAYIHARNEGFEDFVDSVSLMHHYGFQIFYVEGPAENIKVTTPTDYYAFKGYMDARDQSVLWRGDQGE